MLPLAFVFQNTRSVTAPCCNKLEVSGLPFRDIGLPVPVRPRLTKASEPRPAARQNFLRTLSNLPGVLNEFIVIHAHSERGKGSRSKAYKVIGCE